MVSVITLLGLMAANEYIYVKRVIIDYNFWSLIFTFLAMLLLFIGSGKQVVYQKLVNREKIDYNNLRKRSNIWMVGVFFY